MVLICKRCGNYFGALGANAKFCVDCKAELRKKKKPDALETRRTANEKLIYEYIITKGRR